MQKTMSLLVARLLATAALEHEARPAAYGGQPPASEPVGWLDRSA